MIITTILASGQTGFREEISQVESIGVDIMHLIWSSGQLYARLSELCFDVIL